jgi:hypothetical protein
MELAKQVRILLISSVITLIGNWIFTYRAGNPVNPLQAVLGVLILLGVVVIGLTLKNLVPVKLPAIAYISLTGIILSLPWTPGSAFFLEHTSKVQFLALCTPILAYAGISIGKDIGSFAKLGPKIIVIALLVFTGTFVGSAVIAEVLLRATGVI